MSALVSTLVTVGLMTKNSELVVMRACGISLYRAVVAAARCSPLLASAALFGLQEQVLAKSNREADAAERHHPRLAGAGDRRALTGGGSSAENGDIYHYDYLRSAAPTGSRVFRSIASKAAAGGWRR